MTLDLSDPVHVDAIRAACECYVEHGLTFVARQIAARRHGHAEHPQTIAFETITTPSLAAPLVRDLLLPRYPASTRHLIDVMHWRAHDHAKEACLCGKSWPEHVNVTIGAGLWTITAERLPALILALLDATTPEAALDALRKAGR